MVSLTPLACPRLGMLGAGDEWPGGCVQCVPRLGRHRKGLECSTHLRCPSSRWWQEPIIVVLRPSKRNYCSDPSHGFHLSPQILYHERRDRERIRASRKPRRAGHHNPWTTMDKGFNKSYNKVLNTNKDNVPLGTWSSQQTQKRQGDISLSAEREPFTYSEQKRTRHMEAWNRRDWEK